MNAIRRRLRLHASIALVAVLALALLPTLSHLLAAGGLSSAFTEICTPQGARLVAVDGGDEAPAPAGVHLEHCPYCALAAGGGWLPVAVVSPAMPAASGFERPSTFPPAPRTRLAWSAARPRGPPSLS